MKTNRIFIALLLILLVLLILVAYMKTKISDTQLQVKLIQEQMKETAEVSTPKPTSENIKSEHPKPFQSPIIPRPSAVNREAELNFKINELKTQLDKQSKIIAELSKQLQMIKSTNVKPVAPSVNKPTNSPSTAPQEVSSGTFPHSIRYKWNNEDERKLREQEEQKYKDQQMLEEQVNRNAQTLDKEVQKYDKIFNTLQPSKTITEEESFKLTP